MKVVLSKTVRETGDNTKRKKNEHEVMFDFLVIPLRRRIVDMQKSWTEPMQTDTEKIDQKTSHVNQFGLRVK